ncbi:hypothetical protein Q73A0000_02080 [Kaistella flava (ex Peng et al. 2021)]|uniref:Glycosyltransferase RgtA/B/C/D-like domain-containing protein n=1 Tax=Kaistella flava (ex Peng et al. 2021) TaxID=2038776 RepID=A0A7M2Y5W4_9FLAO|nr:hypothetical protein [Kaistella flava (ex Peng et al. 2021)]QOW09229.1 hypothetical protein Q73A0000_02080 [Kaistella flava (ex Peng et al. 2021)]
MIKLFMNLPDSLQNNLEKWGVFFIYLFINGLFVAKYGGHFSFYLLPVYSIAIFVIATFYIKINLKDLVYKYLFWILIGLFFIFSVGLNNYVDGNSLNVDRWDAMEVGIKALFNNHYPYDLKDFMGRESSNLPFLIVLGMPFYLLFGSVGFLQSFSFLLFSYLVFKIFDHYKLRLAALVLLVLSPSYLWEVYTKSDLLSNFILVIGFSYIIWAQFIHHKKIKIEWVSILTALIFLTRLSVVIPLIVILFKAFYKFTVREKLRFISVFILVVSGFIYFFFRNAANWDTILEHNPFTIQGSKQPLFLSLSYIVMAVILAFKVKSYFNIALFSGLVLFIAVFIPYLLYLVEYGYENIMTNSFFDLSFFNMSMPFLIVSLIFILKRNFNISKK